MKTGANTHNATTAADGRRPTGFSRRPVIGVAPLLCLALALGMTGCRLLPEPQADPTRYYTLAVGENDAQPGKGALRIGLRTVELAPHLKKGVMVVRKSEHEIAYQDFARWAEPLEQSLTRALQLRLKAAPKSKTVVVPPFPFDLERDCDVSVYVARCEGVTGGARPSASLVATIEIAVPGADQRVIARRTFAAQGAAWDGRDFAGLAAALSVAAGQLAAEVETLLPGADAGTAGRP